MGFGEPPVFFALHVADSAFLASAKNFFPMLAIRIKHPDIGSFKKLPIAFRKVPRYDDMDYPVWRQGYFLSRFEILLTAVFLFIHRILRRECEGLGGLVITA